jgi:hypothetical protein
MMRVMASLTKAATVAADPGERAFMQHRLAEPYSGRSSPPCRVRPNTRATADAYHAPLNGRLLDYCMARKRRRALFSLNRDQPHDDLTEENSTRAGAIRMLQT